MLLNARRPSGSPWYGYWPDCWWPRALLKAVEGAEDDIALGMRDLQDLQLTATDMVVGLAASGRTPYVIGALRYARELGCPTAAISCNQIPLSRRKRRLRFHRW